MDNKELLKQKNIYEIFLIDLLSSFKDAEKSINNRQLKKYFKDLQCSINNVLSLKEHIDLEKRKEIEKIGMGINDEEK